MNFCYLKIHKKENIKIGEMKKNVGKTVNEKSEKRKKFDWSFAIYEIKLTFPKN